MQASVSAVHTKPSTVLPPSTSLMSEVHGKPSGGMLPVARRGKRGWERDKDDLFHKVGGWIVVIIIFHVVVS